MIRLVLQSNRKRKTQIAANMIMIAIGVSLIFTALLVFWGLKEGIEIGEKRLGADFLIVPEGTGELIDEDELLFAGAPVCVYMTSDLREEVERIDGVEDTEVQFFAQTMNASCCSASTASRLIGFESREDGMIQAWMEESLDRGLEKDEIVVGCNVSGSDEEIKILGKDYRIAGRLEETGGSLDYSILMDMGEARDIVKSNENYAHFWERYGQPENLISSIHVQIDNSKKEEFLEQLKELDGIDIVAEDDIYQQIRSQMNVLKGIMLGVGVLVSIATFVQLGAQFFSLARTRNSEWGLFRALGAKKTDLRHMIWDEVLLIVVGGNLLGYLLTGICFQFIMGYLKRQQSFPFVLDGMQPVLCIGAAIFAGYLLIAFLMAWYPVYKSSRTDIMIVMAKGDID